MKKLIKFTFFGVICAALLGCDGGKNEVKIEQIKEAPADVPIAKSDANLSLPAGCISGKNCFDEQNPPLPVGPKNAK